MTTFPIADFNRAPPAPLVVPQIVEGGGYRTQFILLHTGGASSAITLRYLGNDVSSIAIRADANGTTVPQRFLAILPFKR